MKPRILMLADNRNWAFDIKSQNLIRFLPDFDIKVKFVSEKPRIDPDEFDLLYVFWWGERYQRKFLVPKAKIIKEITSHRWEVEPKYFCNNPEEAKERFMFDAQYLVAHSVKLKKLFNLEYNYNAGVDEDVLKITKHRCGEMKIGWAGKKNDPIKRFAEIILPAVNGYNFQIADGNVCYDDMPAFYNGLDIISVASVAEGTPRPLLEAMACGCFPVTTDVGIAPELIKNGENGLIVDGSVEAFKNAFKWCSDNLDYVRDAGKKNQELIHSTRTWKHSAKQFEDIIFDILSKNSTHSFVDANKQDEATLPKKEFSRYFPKIHRVIEYAYRVEKYIFEKEINPYLPKDKLSKILIIGERTNQLLRYLIEKGYYRISGVVSSNDEYLNTMRYVGHKVERIYFGEPLEFLINSTNFYDCLIINDISRVLSDQKIKLFLSNAFAHLNLKGILLIKTPNLLKKSPAESGQALNTCLEEVGFTCNKLTNSRVLVGFKK